MSAEGTNEIYIFHFARWNWGRDHNQNLNFLSFFFFFFIIICFDVKYDVTKV